MIEPGTHAQIEAALARNDIGGAAAFAQRALGDGQRHPMLFNLAAWIAEERGDLDGAAQLLAQALALAPDDVTVIAAMGGLRRKQGRLAEAMTLLDRAIAAAPDYSAAWLERGYALDVASSLRQAAESFVRAAALDPACAPAWAGQASVAARIGRFAEARGHAERALALDAREPVAHRALAAAELDAGDPDRAGRTLEALLARGDLPAMERINASTLLGDVRDRQRDSAAAFQAYGEAKQVFGALYARDFAASGVETHRRLAERLLRSLEATPPSAWAPRAVEPVAHEAKSHAFLCGYPRSGTTLVENVLASAPGVAALEELPTTYDADRAFLADEDGLARLAVLSPNETTPYRADYWARVAGFGAEGAAFVDMDPLKSIKLPLVARLFPQAHVFLMLRDPRDVVLSCFRRNFRANPATYEYATLEGTARHYDAVMRLVTRCLEVLPLNVVRVRYAELVADFDGVTRRLCDALGVPWTPSLRDFAATATRRDAGTASAAQVRRGLYDGGGQWKRYEAQLAPVLPILEPWIERLEI